MRRTELLESIGEHNVYTAGSIMGDSVLEAERIGRAWLSTTSTTPEPDVPAKAV